MVRGFSFWLEPQRLPHFEKNEKSLRRRVYIGTAPVDVLKYPANSVALGTGGQSAKVALRITDGSQHRPAFDQDVIGKACLAGER